MTRSITALVLLHLIGDALILWLGYYWLGIGESDGAHLLWSAVVILVFLCAALWLHGTALAFFHRQGLHREVRDFFPSALDAARNLIPLFILGLVAMCIYWLLAYLYGVFNHKAFLLASYLTLHWRKPVPPARVLACYHALLWLFRWAIVPALLLPLGAAIARSGWHGFRLRSLRRSFNLLYWIEVCALLLLGIWLPFRLFHWIPELQNFSAQLASVIARVGLGYLLFVFCLLSLEFFTSAGSPRSIQPSTAASP